MDTMREAPSERVGLKGDVGTSTQQGSPPIRGRTAYGGGSAAAGVTIVVHRLALGGDVEVARGVTGPDGSFDIALPAVDGDVPKKHSLIAVTVVDGKGTELTRVGPFTDDTDNYLEIIVPDTTRARSEFDRLRADLTSAAASAGISLDDVDFSPGHRDVVVLARSLETSEQRVRAFLAGLATARALLITDPSDDTTKPRRSDLTEAGAAALLYSLWRSSDNVDLVNILAQSSNDVEPLLRDATDGTIVAKSVVPQIPNFLARLDEERAGLLATDHSESGTATPLSVVLTTVVRDDGVRRSIARLAVAHGAGTEQFWSSLPADEAIPSDTAGQLRTAMELLDASGGHVRLLDRLAELDVLTPTKLASTTKEEWTAILTSTTRNGQIVGTVGPAADAPPTGSALSTTVEILDATIAQLYPTERFVDRLGRDADVTNPLLEARDDIKAFAEANPDFHLRSTPLEVLFDDTSRSREDRTSTLHDPAAAVELLKATQRIIRLLPDSPLTEIASSVDSRGKKRHTPVDPYEATVRLLRDGYDSAFAVESAPRREFIDKYAGVLGGVAGVEIVQKRARQVTDASLMKALEIREVAYPGIASAQPTLTTWRDLFGSGDTCECEHCSSMISPAAYYFDCLKLLRDGPSPKSKTPLDVLTQRRPDLVRLALTCDNTDTRLPYIDLVNEILEHHVVPTWFKPFELTAAAATALTAGDVDDTLRAEFASNGGWELSIDAHVDVAVRALSGSPRMWHLVDRGWLFEVELAGTTTTVTSLTFQTFGTEEELRAAPAHTTPRAYDVLAKEVFPGKLPFALHHAEIAAYLDSIKTSIGGVIEAFENDGAAAAARRDDVAASYLGLSPDEFAIIVGTKTSGGGVVHLGGPTDRVGDFWGGRDGIFEWIPTPPGAPPQLGTWDVALSSVELLLQRSGLTYVELLQIIDCYYINPVVQVAGATGANRTISIASLDPADPATCELSKLRLNGLDVEALRRIHRLVRLKRALRWEYVDIDRALTALGDSDLGPDTVVALTLIDRLRAQTGWPVRELSALWGDLDHARYLDRTDVLQTVLPSLYDELFRKNPQVTTTDPAFLSDPTALTGKLDEHRTALMAAMTIAETDVSSLLADSRVVAANADLDLGNLSAVYRFAGLAAMLGIESPKLLDLLNIAGSNPLVLPAGATSLARVHAVWVFLIDAKRLLARDVDIETLRYVLTEDGSTSSELGLASLQIQLMLEGIRAAMCKVIVESTYVADATGQQIAPALVKLGWRPQDAAAAQRFFNNTEIYSIPLDAAFVPAGLPADSRVSYHVAIGELRCVGTLTAADITNLTTGIGPVSVEFTAAVADLAGRPRDYARTALQRVVAPTFIVGLASLPSDLAIPVELERNLTFDAASGQLRFRGDRSLLDALVVPATGGGSVWQSFRVALRDLRADPSPATVTEDPAPTDNQFFASTQARDDFADQTADPLARCSLALDAISRGTWNAMAPEAATQAHASATGLDRAIIAASGPCWNTIAFDAGDNGPSDLVTSATPITEDAFPSQFVAVRRLHKLALLLAGLQAPPEDAPWLVARSGPLLGFDVLALPASPGAAPGTLAGYRSLAELAGLLRGAKGGSRVVTELFELVQTATFTRDDWVSAMARLYAKDDQTIAGLTDNMTVSIASARSPRFYVDFGERVALQQRVGVAAATMNAWVASFTVRSGNRWTGEFDEDLARNVKLAVQGLTSRDLWLKSSTSIHDTLRERKRDALVAHLLAHPSFVGAPPKSEADLFAKLLLDVEMGSCMTTSRLKQAIASVQTFIQRTILNLEPGVRLDEDVAATWQEWQRRYRLWEANRKILIWPENWLETSLRDDKSESYRSFESRLLQVELTDETAWHALGQYTAARADIANLEVSGIHEQRVYSAVDKSVRRVLHVFARTRATPRRYYHRTREISEVDSLGRWSAWRKLECDIDGDHLLPVSFGRRLYLIWPIIREQAVSATDSTDVDSSKYEIGLAWSVFDGTSWSPKSLSPKGIALTHVKNKTIALDPTRTFTFQATTDHRGISVWAYAVVPQLTTISNTTAVPAAKPDVSVKTDSFSVGQLPTPFLDVKVKTDGAPTGGAIVTLNSFGAGFDAFKQPLPNGAYMSVGPTLITPPVIFPLWGNTVAAKVTAGDGTTMFGTLPTATAEIVLGRVMQLTVTILDPTGPQTVGPIDLNQWQYTLPQTAHVDIDFHRPTTSTTSRTEWPPTHPVKVAGIGGLLLHGNNRVEGLPWPPGDLVPPRRTLPEGEWWREVVPSLFDPVRSDTLELPGQPAPTFQQTPGQFRLLPEMSVAPFSERARFALEVNDKTYLIERSTEDRAQLPVFEALFDAPAQGIAEGLDNDRDETLSRTTQMISDGGSGFRTLFGVAPGNVVSAAAFPHEQVEFGRHDVFASENWETFFHAPLQLADVLTRHNRFGDAQRWLHTIYDPLSAEAVGAQPSNVWRFLPFYEAAMRPPASLTDILLANSSERETVLEWKRNPFSPYAVARLRYSAFMKNVVMRYIDNLVAWADQLYRQDTIESINEATQLYLLAQQILGEIPDRVPPRARPVTHTFRSLTEGRLTDALSSSLGLFAVEISAFIEPSVASSTSGTSLGTMLYFCVPQNERLLELHRTIRRRLQSIRACEDIEGHRRELALFEPEIDPGLLVRAKAAGIDIGSILDDLYAPPPHYRFSILSRTATELCSEVRAFGASLLSALEKQDAEALARLKQSQELVNLANTAEVRKKQVAEAVGQVTGLTRSRELTALRYRYYQRLLGDPGGSIPARGETVPPIEYLPASVPVGATASDLQGLKLAQHETEQIERLDEANSFMLASNVVRTIAGVLHAIPNTVFPVSFGGMHIGAAADAAASVLQLLSTNSSHQASRLGMIGGFVRRQDEWTLQRNSVAQELRQLDAQLDAADIRVEIARSELQNHEQLVEQSKTVDAFFREKYTDQELYEWMVDQLSGIYFQSYELAYRVAKQAEVAFRQDLGLASSSWIKFGYWDSLKRGLLAGESLALDVNRMEAAFLEQNVREFEITKHVSLASLDPNAFLDLKTTGTCQFEVPEWLFDLDYPGHYLRRIRSASVTVPCVVGPYASVNCTMTLESSSIRVDSDATDTYERSVRKPAEDRRFVDIRGASQSIVTSSAQMDSGLFEANLRDERYLPFESHGAASRWRADLRASDNGVVLESASDFILHLRYTARDGGPELEQSARESVNKRIGAAKTSLYRMLSLRHEFPTEWSRFRDAGGTIGPLDLSNRFPALFAHRTVTVGKPRSYFSVTGDLITPLRTGTQKVEFSSSPTSISVTTPKADTLDLAGAMPDDIVVVLPYTVGQRVGP